MLCLCIIIGVSLLSDDVFALVFLYAMLDMRQEIGKLSKTRKIIAKIFGGNAKRLYLCTRFAQKAGRREGDL
jgi:hypothetical protein